ncbi:hypothetical protein [Sediminispirochaeta smaragdinae]|uniref:HNH endonuclease n=1 Tax=Sediminispirochaeta smaragdinae (strain DSM 11293 / JCM 15392 / SEBR 4228) TaxID=573413 RepID=E1R8C3_SEDSS|nr:hypothetical protein [Sediminispirochaeta smaragdinae]ADK79267.1 conserved hypothetical protein [Sediminispirochaeta smaragdinae DSM 11293]
MYRFEPIPGIFYGRFDRMVTYPAVLSMVHQYEESKESKEIEKLCLTDEGYQPFRIYDFDGDFSILKNPLKIFFKTLWDGVLHLSIIRKRIGSLDDYYDDFVRTNTKDMCPYCGLYLIDEVDVKTWEAFDHYVLKRIYPFLSVDFKNLASMCNKCNSGNKGNKDPLHDSSNNRKKAFYLFKEDYGQIEIKVTLAHGDYENLFLRLVMRKVCLDR